MKYHLIGDQGVSMRGIATYLNSLGHIVTGSDLKTGGHRKENITPDIDVVVRTSAANLGSDASVEITEASRLGIIIKKRSQILREITSGKKLIAVSGMHGKTTVTTMAGLLLLEAGFDPTIFVGADVKQLDGVVKIGQSDWFVMEACEYDRAILDFYPKILILTNIEEEHLDTYPGGLPEIKEAFIEYINHIPDDGLIIACNDDKNVMDVLSKVKTKARIIYYGFDSKEYNKLGFNLVVPGKHNVLNALAVKALADYLNIDHELYKKVLSNFTGAKRRFEFLGNYHGADLIDDYGHHPTEIQTTINALVEKYPDKQRIVTFWPHQYKRILPLLNEFGNSFKGASEVIVLPIYFVPGRDEKLNVSSEDLVAKIAETGIKAHVLNDVDKAAFYLRKTLDDNKVLLTIGIPPVYQVIEKILE